MGKRRKTVQEKCGTCGGSGRRPGRGKPDGMPCNGPCGGSGWVTVTIEEDD